MADPEDIYNWRRLDERITTSGQPTEMQLAKIEALGVAHVVNLALHTHEKALQDEAESVRALGMTYTHIPVDFQNPTQEDFDQFCAVMEQFKGALMHVHCIANYRVSAFFYRYRREGAPRYGRDLEAGRRLGRFYSTLNRHRTWACIRDALGGTQSRNQRPDSLMPEQPRHCIVAIVPCNDIEASTAFYGRLGFSVQNDYGRYRILRDGKGWVLHLSAESPEGWVVPGRNPNGVYLYLEDVDGLAAKVGDLIVGVGPEHKSWGMYEFALSDPDGTLVRIGWPSRPID